MMNSKRPSTFFQGILLIALLVTVGIWNTAGAFTKLCANCAGYPTVCLEWLPVHGVCGVKGGVYVNPNCDDEHAEGTSEIDAITRAMDTWNAVDFNFRFVYTGETDHIPFHSGDDPDNTDEITVFGWTSLSLGYSVLAVTHSIFECDTGETVEADIEFADSCRWSSHVDAPPFYPSWYDIESVILHELGHVVGLSHTNIGSAAMYYSISSGSIKRTLHADDVAGALEIYGEKITAVEDFLVYE